MSRMLTNLRRAVLGAAFVGSLGFGAAQAFATPGQPAQPEATCPDRGYDYAYASCRIGCASGGYCAAGGICRCGQIP
ncbi:hypothetical protein [Longimicrobium sp.]|uniref:hypothetical protein n=1 Tax=Longimicrobium sp. TaxID=2029185 RepID=UPI002E358B7E|nr:hypothetical protein [Longimicrobium sp.]HEX6042681.1 hypothetical protein [Longimicrobium sp.]